jgi:phage gp36-like protein
MYATPDDMTTRFEAAELTQLTDQAMTGVVNVAAVTAVLAEADNRINGYVSGRYQTPINPAPALLTDIACDIARYRLYKTTAPDQVVARYNDAIKQLEAISKGTLKLDVLGLSPAASGSSAPIFTSPDRVFTRDTLGGF